MDRSEGWCSSAQMCNNFSEASQLESERGDFSGKDHQRQISGRIPPQLVTLPLTFTGVTETGTDLCAPVHLIYSLSLEQVYCRP